MKMSQMNKLIYNLDQTGDVSETLRGNARKNIGLDKVTNDPQVKREEMGVPNGVALLDESGRVPSDQLPSYVDDVVEGYFFDNKFWKESTHATEIAGETGKIYVDITSSVNGPSYRWSGSAFILISGQNTFSFLKVGSSTISASQIMDTLTAAAGTGIKLTADTSAKKFTIKHTNAVTAGTIGSKTATTGNAVLDIPWATYDSEGHITDKGSRQHTINTATTSTLGVVKLNNGISSDATTAATPKAVNDAINALDVAAVGGSTKVITTISETDGKISATATDVSSTYSATGTTPVNGKAIKAALDTLDATAESSDGTNVKVKVTETDGKVTAVNITTDNTANKSHVHGNITNAGKVTTAVSGTPKALLVTDSSDKVTCTSFDSSAWNKYMCKDGTWKTPAASKVYIDNTSQSAYVLYVSSCYSGEAASATNIHLTGLTNNYVAASESNYISVATCGCMYIEPSPTNTDFGKVGIHMEQVYNGESRAMGYSYSGQSFFCIKPNLWVNSSATAYVTAHVATSNSNTYLRFNPGYSTTDISSISSAIQLKGGTGIDISSTCTGNTSVITIKNTAASVSDATQSTHGLMSAADKTKLDGIATGANKYTHPTYTALTGVPTGSVSPGFGGSFKVNQVVTDGTGHVTALTQRTIHIPGSLATTSSSGLLSATDKARVDNMYNDATNDGTVAQTNGTVALSFTDILQKSVILMNSTEQRYFNIQRFATWRTYKLIFWSWQAAVPNFFLVNSNSADLSLYHDGYVDILRGQGGQTTGQAVINVKNRTRDNAVVVFIVRTSATQAYMSFGY